MPIAEHDPWRVQFFQHIPCPEHISIPTDDGDAWAWYPRERWVYDKLAVALVARIVRGSAWSAAAGLSRLLQAADEFAGHGHGQPRARKCARLSGAPDARAHVDAVARRRACEHRRGLGAGTGAVVAPRDRCECGRRHLRSMAGAGGSASGDRGVLRGLAATNTLPAIPASSTSRPSAQDHRGAFALLRSVAGPLRRRRVGARRHRPICNWTMGLRRYRSPRWLQRPAVRSAWLSLPPSTRETASGSAAARRVSRACRSAFTRTGSPLGMRCRPAAFAWPSPMATISMVAGERSTSCGPGMRRRGR